MGAGAANTGTQRTDDEDRYSQQQGFSQWIPLTDKGGLTHCQKVT